MRQRAGPGLGNGELGEDLQVMLILGTAAAAAATAEGLGFHAGWSGIGPQTAATRARKRAAPEECWTLVRSGHRGEGGRGRGKLGEAEAEGRLLPTVKTGSRVMSKGEVLAQNDGSKTPSPGGRSGAVRPLVLPPFFRAAFEAAIVREGSKTPSPEGAFRRRSERDTTLTLAKEDQRKRAPR